MAQTSAAPDRSRVFDQLSQLDDIHHALRYLSMSVAKNEQHGLALILDALASRLISCAENIGDMTGGRVAL
jgi:hypothetical protein